MRRGLFVTACALKTDFLWPRLIWKVLWCDTGSPGGNMLLNMERDEGGGWVTERHSPIGNLTGLATQVPCDCPLQLNWYMSFSGFLAPSWRGAHIHSLALSYAFFVCFPASAVVYRYLSPYRDQVGPTICDQPRMCNVAGVRMTIVFPEAKRNKCMATGHLKCAAFACSSSVSLPQIKTFHKQGPLTAQMLQPIDGAPMRWILLYPRPFAQAWTLKRPPWT
jgi:hypothetical protein